MGQVLGTYYTDREGKVIAATYGIRKLKNCMEFRTANNLYGTSTYHLCNNMQSQKAKFHRCVIHLVLEDHEHCFYI
jgi:hypothetical protein